MSAPGLRLRRRSPVRAGTLKWILLVLSLAGGSVDAGTYLGLGHVFPANMTGNTVLLMIAVTGGSMTELSRAAVALAAYCGGVALGTVLQRGGSWPGSACTSLTAEAATLAMLLGCWAGLGRGAHYGLIAAAAIAMGCQSAAVRASHVGGVSTTYVTGTLTTAVAGIVERVVGRPQATRSRPALPGEAWVMYGLGALIGAFAQRGWHAGVMAIPLCLVTVSAVAAWWRRPGKET